MRLVRDTRFVAVRNKPGIPIFPQSGKTASRRSATHAGGRLGRTGRYCRGDCGSPVLGDILGAFTCVSPNNAPFASSRRAVGPSAPGGRVVLPLVGHVTFEKCSGASAVFASDGQPRHDARSQRHGSPVFRLRRRSSGRRPFAPSSSSHPDQRDSRFTRSIASTSS